MPKRTRYRAGFGVCLVISLLLFSTASWRGEGQPPLIEAGDPGVVPDRPALGPAAEWRGEGSDLSALKARGRLRILIQGSAAKLSPVERNLLEQYAKGEDLDLVWIPVAGEQQLFSALHKGRGDMLVSTSHAAREEDQVRFTLPWGVSSQQIVGRIGSNRIQSREDLTVRQIALRRTSPVWQELFEYSEKYPGMELLEIPETLAERSILDRVQSGQYDLTVMDSLTLEGYLPEYLDLSASLDLGHDQSMSWAVRKEATAFHESLNQFLNKKHLELDVARIYREDLPALKKRRLLRLITYRSPVNYFYDRGRLKGFEYELMRRFARQHNMRLDVVIADSHEEMQALLQEGKGDVIAASLPEGLYSGLRKIKITRPYNYSTPVIVGSEDDGVILDSRGLENRRVRLPAESPYRKFFQRIKDQGINVNIVDADPGLNTEAVLFRVARGLYDLTVISGHELNAEFTRQLNLKPHFALSDPYPHVWAVRNTDTLLLSALNEYIKKEYRQGFYNVLHARYIDNPNRLPADPKLLAQDYRLSPYDEIVHKYAEDFSFDWRLIVAQMYQESRFNPKAISDAGAEGLMQMLPATAEQIGINELDNPDKSIYGGIRYLDYLRSRFEDDLHLEDRTWFTLAAYNAGYNRVKRARELAEQMDLDKDRWFENVEIAMLMLARPYEKDGEYVRDCRCGQTVVYIREIKTLYNNYVRLTQAVKTAEATQLSFIDS